METCREIFAASSRRSGGLWSPDWLEFDSSFWNTNSMRIVPNFAYMACSLSTWLTRHPNQPPLQWFLRCGWNALKRPPHLATHSGCHLGLVPQRCNQQPVNDWSNTVGTMSTSGHTFSYLLCSKKIKKKIPTQRLTTRNIYTRFPILYIQDANQVRLSYRIANNLKNKNKTGYTSVLYQKVPHKLGPWSSTPS